MLNFADKLNDLFTIRVKQNCIIRNLNQRSWTNTAHNKIVLLISYITWVCFWKRLVIIKFKGRFGLELVHLLPTHYFFRSIFSTIHKTFNDSKNTFFGIIHFLLFIEITIKWDFRAFIYKPNPYFSG